jgi:hypothetical protein
LKKIEKFFVSRFLTNPIRESENIYLGTEGVPDTVLDLGDRTILAVGALDRDALLAVDSLTRGQVLSDKHVLLATTSNEDTGVTVGLL